MTTAAATGLSQTALDDCLRRADPAAVLVPPRILRRVIKRAAGLTGPGLQVPHRKSFVIDRDALLRIAGRAELGLPPDRELPDTLVLLAELDPARLRAQPAADSLRRYWRLLFHSCVHAAVARLRADGKLTTASARARIVRIGRSEFGAAAAVLRQENLLLRDDDLTAIWEEFTAYYLELRYFEPHRLHEFFPLARFQAIEAVLAEDLDAAALLARARPAGFDGSAALAPPDAAPAEPPPALGAAADEAAYEQSLASAARNLQRGNLVRAALRAERAAQAAEPTQRAAAQATVRGYLEQLVHRLRAALGFAPADEAVWRQVLEALAGPAARGFWPSEGRLLYDLQKVCLDHEREVYAVDLIEWAVTWGRRPLRRHLPHQRLVLVVKHLRHAVQRLPAVALPATLRGPFHEHLSAALHRAEERLREQFRTSVRTALDGIGLAGRNNAERVSRDKLVEEILDRVVERGLLTMSDVRDAVARNRVKLPDLQGADEFFLGDKLIRANRALAVHLDGVYRRGEIYLRWLQRLSSAAFGTWVGRFLTRYGALPFGGAYIVLEGLQGLLHEVGISGHIRNWYSVGAVGLFLLGLLHAPIFRRGVLRGLSLGWRGVTWLFHDLPAFVLHLPPIRALLESRPYLLLYLLVLKPLLFAAPLALGLHLTGALPVLSLGSGGAVFLLMSLLLNSRFGMEMEELLADRTVRGYELVRRDVLPGLFYLIVGLFRGAVERIEQLLYTVDEWLRFRTGDTPLSAAVKPLLGVVWFAITYVVRVAINLFLEPTFNPIKHFPVVTVAAKGLLPFVAAIHAAIVPQLVPLVGSTVAELAFSAVFLAIPGLAGFLVWELKENWKLYEANQPATLRPISVGSHGETVLRLLRPGLHSGTVPKHFARLRHATGAAARKQEVALHHVAEALLRFVERDLLAVLARSRRWSDRLRLRVGGIHLGTNRFRLELRCRDVADQPLLLDVDEEAGRLLAGVVQPGWLPRLSAEQSRALADALAGFYHLAGVDVVRGAVEATLPPATSYGLDENGLVTWAPPPDFSRQTVQPLDGAWSFSARPICWHDWMAAWELDGAGDKEELLLPNGALLLAAPPVKETKTI